MKDNPEQSRRRARRNYAANREAKKRKVRQWQKENPNLVKEYCHKYQAKQLGLLGNISSGAVDRLYNQQNGMCAYAGLLCNHNLVPFHVDHIMPLSLDGLHEESNIQLLCVDCSKSKAAKHPDQFLRDALKSLKPISPGC